MSTAIVPASPAEISTLPDRERGEVITHALVESKAWLAVATQGTDPTPIAEFKAWAATVAEMTKQKNLAGEIQQDAREMVRRAERGIGVAIRNGQEAGGIRRQHASGGPRRDYIRKGQTVHVTDQVREPDLISPVQFFSNQQEVSEIYALTDAVSDEQFEDAITEARAEGNLSRANVIRKVQGVKTEDSLTPVEKLVRIRELAPTGRTSGQIAADVGVGEAYVRRVARQNDITITADKVMHGTRRLDHTRFVNETVNALEALASGLDVLNLEQVDPTQLTDWATSLTDSLKKLSGLARRIKEMTHE